MTGYVCKYTPVEVLEGLGGKTVFLRAAEERTDAGGQIHPNVCGYAKAVLQAVLASGYDSVVLTDCCDSLKRAADVLEKTADCAVYRLSLPRAASSEAAAQYAGEIGRLIKDFSAKSGKPFSEERFRAAVRRAEAEARTGPYVALLGARTPEWLQEMAAGMCALPVRDCTCARDERPFGTESVPNPSMEWYAGQLLGQMPCMRMRNVDRRGELCLNREIRGIIYHTVKFCDFYGFESADLRPRVPTLKMETNYERLAAGQAETNLQAFFECNGWRKKARSARGEGPAGEKGPRAYFAGIDSGSTTTKAVLLDEDGRIVGEAVVPTGAKSRESAQKAFDRALEQAGVARGAVARAVATGYGRQALGWADADVTEISCHARGAHHLFPQARTIIDIGGQDSKVIRVDGRGGVADFTMNDKCAAGTGKFLELMAGTLETDMDGFARIGLEWKENIVISSMCAVFAESEVVSLIAQNREKADIIHGLNSSIANRVYASAARQNAVGAFVMTGGVARNGGVVRALAQRAGEPILLPEKPQLCGALGAALYALEQRVL